MDEALRLNPAIALTGATGFIGRELQRQLCAAGLPVRALLRPGSRHHKQLLPGVQPLEVALNDERSLAMLAKMRPEQIAQRQPGWAALLAELHDAHHQPGYWQELVGQMLDMWPNEPDLSAEQLAQIGAPTLLIAGERDNFGSPEQQLFMRRAMPRAQLCILPAASHPVMNQLPQLFQLVALQFLASV